MMLQAMMMSEGSQLITQPFATNLSNTSATMGILSASETFGTDGTMSYSHASGPSSWYAGAPVTGIGSNWWVRITINTSANTTTSGFTPGSFSQVTSALLAQFSNNATNALATGTASIDFSPDGSTVAASGSITWTVGYSP